MQKRNILPGMLILSSLPLLIWLTKDIAKRKRMEGTIKEGEEKYRIILENIEDGYFEVDIAGNLTFFNDSLCRMLGYSKEEMMGMDDRKYTDQENAKKLYQAFNKVYRTGEPIKGFGWEVMAKDGTKLFGEVSVSLIKDSKGQPTGFRGIARDITERKRAEEALRRSEKRLRLLSSQLLSVQEKERKLVAQEIHDSIGASLAAAKFKVESVMEEMGENNHQGKVILESVIPILQGTIEEARRIQMYLRPSILDDLGILTTINWLCGQFESTYSDIRIKKEINIQEDEVPESLKIIIYRVLQEALNNIAKHSKAALVLLNLTKITQAIHLVVQDSGQGFDVEETYSRKGTTTKGLGLDSMRERTELSGGSFSIESHKGFGTVIRATWPVE
jgi:PAS domain S-box-containing protein